MSVSLFRKNCLSHIELHEQEGYDNGGRRTAEQEEQEEDMMMPPLL
jgi:hypothetical protein